MSIAARHCVPVLLVPHYEPAELGGEDLTVEAVVDWAAVVDAENALGENVLRRIKETPEWEGKDKGDLVGDDRERRRAAVEVLEQIPEAERPWLDSRWWRDALNCAKQRARRETADGNVEEVRSAEGPGESARPSVGNPGRISGLIFELRAIMEEHGDIPVLAPVRLSSGVVMRSAVWELQQGDGGLELRVSGDPNPAEDPSGELADKP